jgi:hypothetical protein
MAVSITTCTIVILDTTLPKMGIKSVRLMGNVKNNYYNKIGGLLYGDLYFTTHAVYYSMLTIH